MKDLSIWSCKPDDQSNGDAKPGDEGTMKTIPNELHLRRDIDPVARNIESFVEIPQETDFLVEHAFMAKHGLIEIGSWKGRSTIYLADVAKHHGLPLVAVDTWVDCDIPEYFGANLFPEFKHNLMRLGLFDRVTLVKKLSKFAVVEFKRSILPNKKFDFIFIDGDHKYDSVKQDFELWVPLLERPAIVVFHDVLRDTVQKFIDEVKPLGKWRERGNIGSLILENEKEPETISSKGSV